MFPASGCKMEHDNSRKFTNFHIKLLEDALTMIRQDTGNVYRLHLKEMGGKEIEILPLEQRDLQITVTMFNDYKELNGTYSSIEEIKNRRDNIAHLVLSNLDTDGRVAKQIEDGIVRRCGMYWGSGPTNNETTEILRKVNSLYNLIFDLNDGEIYLINSYDKEVLGNISERKREENSEHGDMESITAKDTTSVNVESRCIIS